MELETTLQKNYGGCELILKYTTNKSLLLDHLKYGSQYFDNLDIAAVHQFLDWNLESNA